MIRESEEAARQEAIALCIDDESPAVRFLAVKALGTAGWEEAVAFHHDPDVPAEYRAAALRHLALTFGRERSLALVEAALDAWEPELIVTAVDVVGGWRLESATSKLLSLAELSLPGVAEHVAMALGRIGSRSAERGLLALMVDKDRDVRKAAVDALARAGTLDAVPVLSQVREVALRRHVRDAISAIQARCGRKHEGALSISNSDGATEGAVSMSDDAGAMSLDEG